MFKTLLGFALALLLVPAAWAQSSYRIQPGDTLQLEVVEDPALNRNVLVLPDGSISVPMVGSLRASGRTVEDVRSAISSGLASNFASPPTVFVSVGTLGVRTTSTVAASAPVISVYALGEVSKPGKVDVAPGTTLLQFLAESGGTTRFAATKRIQLRRTDSRTNRETVYHYNYRAVQNGAAGPVITLQPGDVIVVPERRLFE